MRLSDGARVGVVGGGPAGSLFSYFLLRSARELGIEVSVDIYEPRDFNVAGPAGCNMCGGIVSESLVQLLATEGINLPTTVVQRGIDSYVLHMDEGNVRIDTRLEERRIAAVHRGAGPKGVKDAPWRSFDGFLLDLARKDGARHLPNRVRTVAWKDDLPQAGTGKGETVPYELLAVATGVNTAGLKIFEELEISYTRPKDTKTYIRDLYLGQETVNSFLGSCMHVFLLSIPRLEFAALVPKGEYVTLCLLGTDIDEKMLEQFLRAPEVRMCLPPDWQKTESSCQCSPRINTRATARPFADRIVFVGDSGVTRLYKDGIGAAYRTAKAAATTAVFEGVSTEAFRRNYWPICRGIEADNKIGRVIFAGTGQAQKIKPVRRGIMDMIAHEQRTKSARDRMSGIVWDVFTGSAPYRDVLRRGLHPSFLARFLYHILIRTAPSPKMPRIKAAAKDSGSLGKLYPDGETIIRQGDDGDCMFVIQAGRVEVLEEKADAAVRLNVLGEGDFFGEMALFDQDVRSATVRALGDARVLTVDERTFLRRVHEDPALAFRIAQVMAQRIRKLDTELADKTAPDDTPRPS